MLVDIVIPVYNEERVLEWSVHRLHDYLSRSDRRVTHFRYPKAATHFPWSWRILIVDNASTDGTFQVAKHLAAELENVEAIGTDRKGRGLALREAWMLSPANVVAYMDVDHSTDLRALLPLVAPLVAGHSDIAIGTRWHRDARVTRGLRRRAISWTYNHALRAGLGVHFSDAMCGFKAMRAGTAKALLPMVQDDQWFFDAELLVLAERAGMRIHEVPLDWVDDPDSRVKVAKTAVANLRGIWRMRRHRAGDAVGARRAARASRSTEAEHSADRHLTAAAR